MEMINSLKDIIDQFDTFILDQWGVLHNGGQAFEQAVATLEFLKLHKKKVVILSNSGHAAKFSYNRLTNSGISRDLYLDVLTSGDHMRQNFKAGKFDHLGTKALFFTWDNDYTALQSCGLTESNVEQASLILCCGFARNAIDDYMDELNSALQRNLELIISNPDLVSKKPDGSIKFCPGTIAKTYQEMGGTVHWHGKPQHEIYEMCKTLVGGWNNAIAVGDSLEHDIAGANNAGIASLFITSGIHSGEISDKASIEALSDKFAAKPTYYVDWFKV
jgi:HAD superfamily hydrolase (TIGR01459 family)